MITDAEVAKVRELLDREEIRKCVIQTSRGVDRLDKDLVVDSYHPDGKDDHGEFIGPPDEFADYAFERGTEHWDFTMHCVMNHSIELDGDTAHSELYYIAFFRRTEGADADVCFGRYIDRLERRDGEWRIATRVTSMEFRGELHGEEGVPPEGMFIQGTLDDSDISYMRPLQIEREDRPWANASSFR